MTSVRSESDALIAVANYCRTQELIANENKADYAAAGMARAYKDVADRIDARLAAITSPNETHPDTMIGRRHG